MIEIHSHILPALDDGPASLQESAHLVAALVEQGITHIVATPRYGPGYVQVSASDVQKRVSALEIMLHRQRIPVRLFAGHEVDLDMDVERLLASNTLATINDGPYVLLNMPTIIVPDSLPDLISRMRQVGFTPILAHVERCTDIRRDTNVLVPLVERGALTQVTTTSLSGFFGPGIRRTAEELLARNLVHMLAMGAHGMKDQPELIRPSLRAALALVGRERLKELTIEAPRSIIKGLPYIRPPIES